MADIRDVLGDQQAGPKVLAERNTKKFEKSIPYKEQKVGFRHDTVDYGTRPNVMSPHHILGIKALAAFYSGSENDNAVLRADANTYGEQPGNAPGNYTGVYDGVKSTAGKAIGIRSTDHADIHDQDKTIAKKLGIEINRSDRTLDKHNGVYIKDLPLPIKRALQMQYMHEAQKVVTQVQQDRSATIQALHPKDTYQQRTDRIKYNPTSFASEPRQPNAFVNLLRNKVNQIRSGVKPKPKPKVFPSRLTESPAPISFFRNEARMVPTAPVGTLQGGGYRVDMDPMGLGGSIMLP